MTVGWYILGGLACILVAAALIEAYLKRNRKRPLVDMRPDAGALKRKSWEIDPVTMAEAEARRLEQETSPRATGRTDANSAPAARDKDEKHD